MTAQKKRSAKSRSRDGGRAAGVQSDGADIGWGLGAESEDEDLFMRRVLFAVIVAVLGCMGAWFMVTTVSAGKSARDMLTTAENAPKTNTIMLLSFRNGPSERRAATLLAGKPEIKALAGPHEIELVDLPTGECALCVGRFDDAASPEAARLLKEFAQYAAEGVRPFAQAAIMPIAR
jgi:hypothetical protein